VRTISAGPWGLVIGGQFTRISGVWAHNVAVWRDAAAAQIELAVPVKAAYGTKIAAKVTVPGGTGTVTLTGAGPARTRTLVGGSATFDLPRTLSAGNHSLKVQYSGDSQFLAGTATRSLTVTRAATDVRTTVTQKARARRDGTLKVTVASKVKGGSAPSGTLTLKLSHSHSHQVLKRALHGKAVRITLPRLGRGSWKLVASYHGDADHKAASHTLRLRVR
jgi:hypothetical protein